MHAIYYLVLMAVQVFGLCINVFTLPGLWVMVLAAGIYAAITRFAFVTPRVLIVLIVLALIAEVIEFFAAGAGPGARPRSRRGLIGAIVGGIAGGILFSFILPLVLTLVGVCVGTFAGALVAELSAGKQMGQSLRIGVGAAKGRLLGTVCKLFFGCIMFFMTLWYAWPSSRAQTPVLVAPMVAPLPPVTTRGV